MSGNQQAFQKAMSSGHSAAWEQSWEQAAGFYRAALEEFPDQTSALTSLGLALYEIQDYAGALKYYQQAAALAADDPIPHEKAARIYEKQGLSKKAVQSGLQAAELYLKGREVDKAIQSWTFVLGLDPDNRIAHTRLALVFEKLGRKAEAIKEYLIAASLMQRAGEAEKARQIVQYCEQMVPDQPDVQNALTLLATGQMLPRPVRSESEPAKAPAHKPAEKSLPTSSGVDPVAEASQKALAQLADLLFDQGDEPAPVQEPARRGITQLAQGLSSKPLDSAARPRILAYLGQAIDSLTRKEHSHAASELEKAVDIGLSNPAVFFELGYLLVDQDASKSLQYLRKSVKQNDFALAAHLLQGQILNTQGKVDEAAASYLQALRLADAATVEPELAGDLMQVYDQVIEMQTRSSDPTRLKTLCETIAGQLLRPGWLATLKMARAQLPPQPDDSPAMPLAEMLLESRSGQVIESQAKVRSLTREGKNRSAMEEAYYALQFAPTYLPLHIEIAELLLKEGHISEAVDKFLLVAQLYNLRGDTTHAIQMLKRYSAKIPVDVAMRGQLVELLIGNGQVDEAIQEYITLAGVYYRLAEINQARQSYLSAMRLTQQSSEPSRWAIEVLRHMTDIDLQRLDYRSAVKTFEQLRSLEPDQPSHRVRIIDLNFSLGQDAQALTELDGYLSLIEKSGSTDKAITFLTQVVESHPEKVEVRHRLADRCQRSGNNELAIEQLDAIADTLLSAGNQAAARKVVETIINLNPSNADEYRTALKKIR